MDFLVDFRGSLGLDESVVRISIGDIRTCIVILEEIESGFVGSFILKKTKGFDPTTKLCLRTSDRICPNLLQDSRMLNIIFSFSNPSNSTSSQNMFPLHGCLLKKNLDGKILDFYFSHALFLSQLSTQKPAMMNFGW